MRVSEARALLAEYKALAAREGIAWEPFERALRTLAGRQLPGSVSDTGRRRRPKGKVPGMNPNPNLHPLPPGAQQ